MHISIAVAVHNECHVLKDCLEAIRRSSYSDYELLVIDDGSSDGSAEIARQYADEVVRHDQNCGLAAARHSALTRAKGEVVLFVDADIIIQPDAVARIADFFEAHPAAAAVTGRLAKDTPEPGFFSRYKNLYMHYIFGLLPEEVSFLYGSISAIRRCTLDAYHTMGDIGEDTELGQQLVKRGYKVHFLKDLKVCHRKQHNLQSLIRNDFRVPFYWTRIFLAYRGWQQLGKNGTGFAHSPKEQLISLMIIAAWWLYCIGALFFPLMAGPGLALMVCWLALNMRFFLFLWREAGFSFLCKALIYTWIDQSVMLAGLICGFLVHLPLLRHQSFRNASSLRT